MNAQNSIKDYVCVVHEQFSESQVEMYTKFAGYFAKTDYNYLNSNIKNQLKSKSFGSGFIITDSNGNNYVITNNHVVPLGETATVDFENSKGEKKTYTDLKLVARDKEIDVAIFKFVYEKPFKEGLKIETKPQTDNTEVYSAGFPGFNQKPLWQFGKGTITNVKVTEEKLLIDPTISSIIQHSAQVDSGNSGGPLLIKDSSSPSGYAVIGINTAKAFYRQAANYAIPAPLLQDFIDSSIYKIEKEFFNLPSLKVKRFADTLNNKKSNFYDLVDYISRNNITDKNLKELADKILNEKSNDSISLVSNWPLTGPVVKKAIEIWTEYNTIELKENKKNSDSDEDSDKDEDKELPDTHFYKITDTTLKNDSFTALLTDEEDKAVIKTTWVLEEGSWMLSEINYVDKGKRAPKNKKDNSAEVAFFTIGSSKHISTDVHDYDDNKLDFKIFPSFEMTFNTVMFNWLTFGFDYIYQVTEMDTLKLWGLGTGIQIPLEIKNVGFYPFARTAAYYTIFSDVAAYGYSYEGGLRFLIKYNEDKTDGLGIQSSVRYLETKSLNRKCNDYEDLSVTFSAVFLIY